MKKRILALTLATVMLFGLLVGCNSEAQQSPPPQGTEAPTNSDNVTGTPTGGDSEYRSIVVTIGGDPGSLAPWGSTAMGRKDINGLQYEYLCYKPSFETDQEMEYGIAKSVESKGDGVYIVTIYDYVTDSKGNPITADDVAFSYRMADEDGNNKGAFANMDHFTPIDTYSLELKLVNERKGDLLTALSGIDIISEKSWNESTDQMVKDPCGTGAYKITHYEPGSYIEFERRDDYWQTDESLRCTFTKANMDRITLQVVKDNTAAALALMNGDVDLATEINDSDLVNFVAPDGSPMPGYYLETFADPTLMNLSFNCSETSLCSDLNLRKAIACCIDNAAIAYNLYGDKGTAAIGMSNPSWVDSDQSLLDDGEYYNYEEGNEKALEYLAASNYNGETLSMLVNPMQSYKDAATLIAAYCDAIGIKVELRMYESALYEELHNHHFSAGDEYDMDLQFSSSGGTFSFRGLRSLDIKEFTDGKNHCFIYDEELQRLNDEAAKPDSTKEDVVKFQQYVEDNCYCYAICYYDKVLVAPDRFTDLATNYQGIIPRACTVTPDK